MSREAWLPINYQIGADTHLASAISTGEDWQVWTLKEGGAALLASPSLAARWVRAGLLNAGETTEVAFGELKMAVVIVAAGRTISALAQSPSPGSFSEALAFATALRDSRAIDPESSFQDGLYIEALSRILPTTEGEKPDDGLILGKWLSGGLAVSAANAEILQGILTWIAPDGVCKLAETAGILVIDLAQPTRTSTTKPDGSASRPSAAASRRFELPGRPELEAFFNDHVIDIVQNPEHYRPMGIGNPSAIVLEGPPGTGKTFAVDKLADFLGWPKFSIDASSIGSPYIHETSRKVSELFHEAMKVAPAIVVIDEMEAFLPVRDATAGSHHRVEEVAEFLRRIPEAVAAGVLIIAMTNRLDMIDPAASRRGRFDHVIHVGYPGATEVQALLDNLVNKLPLESDIKTSEFASELAGRPLSDAAFVVREAARISAKERHSSISREIFLQALASAPAREGQEEKRRIGF
jgi:cell division protease FtsH